jgi:hypothetical protein
MTADDPVTTGGTTEAAGAGAGVATAALPLAVASPEETGDGFAAAETAVAPSLLEPPPHPASVIANTTINPQAGANRRSEKNELCINEFPQTA